MSHGIRRVRETLEAQQTRRKKEQTKIEQYTKLTDQVLRRNQENDFSSESLDLTKQLLALNPEFYTVWNYRRHILMNGVFPSRTPEEICSILDADLSLTMSALRQYPKVYWIWNHRRWCLQHIPDAPGDNKDCWRRLRWRTELQAVEKLLDADPRNFHAWNYRRYILATSGMQVSPVSELAYTTRKIESNFSNFSAWHHRSKIFPTILEQIITEEEQRRMKDEEFDLIKQAMYTDPGDQSVWLYHRWLIGQGDDKELLDREIQVIEELLEIEPDSKWCLDTLVHYKMLQLKNNSYCDETVVSCIGFLKRLQTIDPFREARYTEMSQSLKDNYPLDITN